MSKKSRKRNKKILALAGAIGLGMAAKRKRNAAIDTGIASAEADKGSAMLADSKKSVTGTNYPGENKAVVVSPKINNTKFRTRGRITDSAGNTIASAGVRPDKMPNNPPPSIGNPYSKRTGTGARRFASGGRTGYNSGGAAKRGISPILMKGKK